MVREISPFAQLASVPLTDVDWPATPAMTAVAVALAVAGATGCQRCDLQG